jgi:hypothetical protein
MLWWTQVRLRAVLGVRAGRRRWQTRRGTVNPAGVSPCRLRACPPCQLRVVRLEVDWGGSPPVPLNPSQTEQALIGHGGCVLERRPGRSLTEDKSESRATVARPILLLNSTNFSEITRSIYCRLYWANSTNFPCQISNSWTWAFGCSLEEFVVVLSGLPPHVHETWNNMDEEIVLAFGINLLWYHPTIYHPANSFQVQYNAKTIG